MAQQLVFTSVPSGLRPGTRGFTTVAASSNMSPPLMSRLESLSGYQLAFNLSDPQAHLNPICFSHVKLEVAGGVHHVLSRIAPAGSDYSGRSNTIAHHVLLDAAERQPAGPAAMLAQPGWLIENWAGPPCYLDGPVAFPQPDPKPQVCSAWESLTGDAGWGGVLPAAFARAPHQPAYVIYPPGANVLTLLRESLSLLPAAQRWSVTFSTYFAVVAPNVTCQWRGVLAGTAAAKALSRANGALVIDLTRPMESPAPSLYTDAARAGRLAQPSMPVVPQPIQPIPLEPEPPGTPTAAALPSRQTHHSPARRGAYTVEAPPLPNQEFELGNNLMAPPPLASHRRLWPLVVGAMALLMVGGGIGMLVTWGMMGGGPVVVPPPRPTPPATTTPSATAPATGSSNPGPVPATRPSPTSASTQAAQGSVPASQSQPGSTSAAPDRPDSNADKPPTAIIPPKPLPILHKFKEPNNTDPPLSLDSYDVKPLKLLPNEQCIINIPKEYRPPDRMSSAAKYALVSKNNNQFSLSSLEQLNASVGSLKLTTDPSSDGQAVVVWSPESRYSSVDLSSVRIGLIADNSHKPIMYVLYFSGTIPSKGPIPVNITDESIPINNDMFISTAVAASEQTQHNNPLTIEVNPGKGFLIKFTISEYKKLLEQYRKLIGGEPSSKDEYCKLNLTDLRARIAANNEEISAKMSDLANGKGSSVYAETEKKWKNKCTEYSRAKDEKIKAALAAEAQSYENSMTDLAKGDNSNAYFDLKNKQLQNNFIVPNREQEIRSIRVNIQHAIEAFSESLSKFGHIEFVDKYQIVVVCVDLKPNPCSLPDLPQGVPQTQPTTSGVK